MLEAHNSEHKKDAAVAILMFSPTKQNRGMTYLLTPDSLYLSDFKGDDL